LVEGGTFGRGSFLKRTFGLLHFYKDLFHLLALGDFLFNTSAYSTFFHLVYFSRFFSSLLLNRKQYFDHSISLLPSKINWFSPLLAARLVLQRVGSENKTQVMAIFKEQRMSVLLTYTLLGIQILVTFFTVAAIASNQVLTC